ncbi:hypothetical protein V1477_009608 [Vespula maculifrons]|uniref:Uncharacterized protein n=1 Tax=Vespula maculifrons TaxID=7453 RepID=A0ABD2CAI8_VESMC
MEKNQRGRIRTKILELGLHVKIWTGSCLSCPLVPPFAECADTRDRVSGHDGQSETRRQTYYEQETIGERVCNKMQGTINAVPDVNT